jgi:hypothetical protein
MEKEVDKGSTEGGKSKSKLLVVGFVIILIFVLLLAGYIIYDKILSSGDGRIIGDSDIGEEGDEDGDEGIFEGITSKFKSDIVTLGIDSLEMNQDMTFPKKVWISYEVRGDTALTRDYKTRTFVLKEGVQISECNSPDFKLVRAIGKGRKDLMFYIYSWSCTGQYTPEDPLLQGDYTVKINFFKKSTDEFIGSLERPFNIGKNAVMIQ